MADHPEAERGSPGADGTALPGPVRISLSPVLKPGFGLDTADLLAEHGPARIDAAFAEWLSGEEPALWSRLDQARQQASGTGHHYPTVPGSGNLPEPASPADQAAFLIEIARAVDRFIPILFGIQDAAASLTARHRDIEPLLRTKYKFVKRQALLGVTPQDRESVDADALRARLRDLGADPDDEAQFASRIQAWTAAGKSENPAVRDSSRAALAIARDYAAWAAGTEAGRIRHTPGVLFDHPQALDAQARVEHLDTGFTPVTWHRIKPAARVVRNGFALTDPGTDLAGALDEARYCLKCHQNGKDSCSHGLRTAAGETPFLRSPYGEALGGCPLEERISEFLQLKSEGAAIGALAMIALDNPMVAATGHRICNDCLKACIYQQQTPVDIPQAETRVLRDVLELPWGFEIYALLVRWNPLNLGRPVPASPTGRRVLIVGAGPAGFTLAHYLLNDGHDVVLIDGLRIEPARWPDAPIHDVNSLREPLDSRIANGFGGVAEYGITVRWDKNFLSLIRLMLERRARCRLFGGVRFGGTIGTDAAFALGFDHIALCTGAGRPTLLGIPNELAPGVRAASDFLMALQLTGAARASSIANLQMRLPVLVVGGGLTALDTATESFAYYIAQVDRFLARHEALVARHGESAVRAGWRAGEQAIADEFIAHGLAIREARCQAAHRGEPADLAALVQSWGGVTVVYRKRMIDSPAYRLNPEELANALAEGIVFAEQLQPLAVAIDPDGACQALIVRDAHGSEVSLPARAVFIAAGTHPNAMLADEEPAHYALDQGSFMARDANGQPVSPGVDPKPAEPQFFCLNRPDGRRVSFLGDAHPAFAGNVVRALASARQAAPQITAALADLPTAACPSDGQSWFRQLADDWQARVVKITRLAPGIIQVRIHAPAAARAFRPGQFFRLQNFERLADQVADETGITRLGMEGLAMTGASADPVAGDLELIVLEMGGSSDLCARLEPGEPVVLMGPTGSPTEIPAHETVILAGGGLGNAVLFSIGAALRAAGCTVIYFAAYRRLADRFRVADIEAAADQVVWCCEESPGFTPTRAQDRHYEGNVVAALDALAGTLDLSRADRLIAIGSDAMMSAVADLCQGRLAARLKPQIRLIASINSPMQCMMKAICAQCLQRQVDPQTGVERIVFSCAEQDQSMRCVDFNSLRGRLAQNSVAENHTRWWLRHCLSRIISQN